MSRTEVVTTLTLAKHPLHQVNLKPPQPCTLEEYGSCRGEDTLPGGVVMNPGLDLRLLSDEAMQALQMRVLEGMNSNRTSLPPLVPFADFGLLPSIPPLGRCGGFSYVSTYGDGENGQVWFYNGIPRESIQQLTIMFNPNHRMFPQNYKLSAMWAEAQLRLYGKPVPPTDVVGALFRAVMDVANPLIWQSHLNLCYAYEKRYKEAVNQTDKANTHPYRFIQEHFQNLDGGAAPEKVPLGYMILGEIRFLNALQNAVAATRGLALFVVTPSRNIIAWEHKWGPNSTGSSDIAFVSDDDEEKVQPLPKLVSKEDLPNGRVSFYCISSKNAAVTRHVFGQMEKKYNAKHKQIEIQKLQWQKKTNNVNKALRRGQEVQEHGQPEQWARGTWIRGLSSSSSTRTRTRTRTSAGTGIGTGIGISFDTGIRTSSATGIGIHINICSCIKTKTRRIILDLQNFQSGHFVFAACKTRAEGKIRLPFPHNDQVVDISILKIDYGRPAAAQPQPRVGSGSRNRKPEWNDFSVKSYFRETGYWQGEDLDHALYKSYRSQLGLGTLPMTV
ncbi:hypothetical protein B0H63DRAFT_513640 [Podospora didyma]|uniref:Uncharacterized protein n=1 Tax=Podospora didyma TaxID=330526 RepID=A0AAE0K8M6_9PEZI|nr:hypothetical protein B0H63DRAFT_513640 [Podospora didyma]